MFCPCCVNTEQSLGLICAIIKDMNRLVFYSEKCPRHLNQCLLVKYWILFAHFLLNNWSSCLYCYSAGWNWIL